MVVIMKPLVASHSFALLFVAFLFLYKQSSISGSVSRLANTLRHSVLDLNGTICFGPQLGYNIPTTVTNLAGVSPSLVQAIEESLLVVLVLHPVAGALSFLGILWSLFLESHPAAIFTLIVAIVTAIVASVVFAIDLALVIVARNELSSLPAFYLAVDWGNAVWLVLVAVLMTWLAVISLSARVCGVRK
jgi:hypothetical protein